jgi:hypothetical protein
VVNIVSSLLVQQVRLQECGCCCVGSRVELDLGDVLPISRPARLSDTLPLSHGKSLVWPKSNGWPNGILKFPLL